jgi:hypothetical protein
MVRLTAKTNQDTEIIAIRCQLWYLISMEFLSFFKIIQDEPVFETGLFSAINPRDPSPAHAETGRKSTSRRLYCLAPPFQKLTAFVSDRQPPASRIVCQPQSALHITA